MSKLTKEARDKLPDSAFALPGRKYPIHNSSHARNALARASEEFHKGKLSKKDYDTVVRKAKKVIADHSHATESFTSLWNRSFRN